MPPKKRKVAETSSEEESELQYVSGFGGDFLSEVIPGVVPRDQHSPQRCPFGLYAEQLSGTAFTVARENNRRVWLYRIRPSVDHLPFQKVDVSAESMHRLVAPADIADPSQIRWKPHPLPEAASQVSFLQGMVRLGGAGDPSTKTGFSIFVYSFNSPMNNQVFGNSDGDFLFVPQQGTLTIKTELGILVVAPEEICVIPRGIRFTVNPGAPDCRGYVAETFDNHWKLPELGVIGTTGLADAHHFDSPTAHYEDVEGEFWCYQKFNGTLWKYKLNHSILDVVGWRGNYVPFKYALSKYGVINTVSFDHLDPSIFTVLTCPSNSPGTACMDLAIFPPRWGVAEHTFRPPYFHRNCMTEYMGLITGSYEAKEGGFLPGGGSLHSCMSPHGPDRDCFEGASKAPLAPQRVAEGTMAFMFESGYVMNLTEYGAHGPTRATDYHECWQNFTKAFDPTDSDAWTKALQKPKEAS